MGSPQPLCVTGLRWSMQYRQVPMCRSPSGSMRSLVFVSSSQVYGGKIACDELHRHEGSVPDVGCLGLARVRLVWAGRVLDASGWATRPNRSPRFCLFRPPNFNPLVWPLFWSNMTTWNFQTSTDRSPAGNAAFYPPSACATGVISLQSINLGAG
jgi:hypothetical protein